MVTLYHLLAGTSETVLDSEVLACLLDDAYQLSRASQLSITVFVDLMSSSVLVAYLEVDTLLS